MIPDPESKNSTVANLFKRGNYTHVALHGGDDDWRTFASLGILGRTEKALAGLSGFAGPEPRFFEAVTHWIVGDEARAIAGLRGLQNPHASRLLEIIQRPKIHVLTQIPGDRSGPWDLMTGIAQDPKFDVHNISFHSQDLANKPHADVRSFYDSRTPPDFYACMMIEWHLVPTNLRALPCPLIGVTADYDVHAQVVYPWLGTFDEIVVESHSQWDEVSQMACVPVSAFARMNGSARDLPIPGNAQRDIDFFLSGTILHPYHPDKAQLLCDVLKMPDVNFYINNGYSELEAYLALLRRSKVVFTYVRYPGSMPTRGLEALSMGAAVVTQKDCVLTLYAGENEGVVTYSADRNDLVPAIRRVLDNWDDFGRRARRGAEIIRREFALERVASQYFRFLTFLAARPREIQSEQRVGPTLSQKKVTMWRGWAPKEPHVREARLAGNLEIWHKEIESGPNASTFVDLSRELVLEYAASLAQHNDKTKPKLELLAGAKDVFQSGILRFPNSLVLRFNYARSLIHYGGPEDVETARALIDELLFAPAIAWAIDPMEDVFPWEFMPEYFNYRSYLSAVVKWQCDRSDVSAALYNLIIASLCYYRSTLESVTLPWLKRAVEHDPSFAIYSFQLALALKKVGDTDSVAQAEEILIRLAGGSCVWLDAMDLLEHRLANVGPDGEMLAELHRAAVNARRSVTSGDAAWNSEDNALNGRTKPESDVQVIASRKPGDNRRPLVSALIPVYRAERFLRGMIEDLEAQTIADQIEIVICDTGSPQNEMAIALEYQKRYDNIVFIRTEHRENSHEALNRCIAAATGKYYTLACVDDRRRPDALELLVGALEQRPDIGMAYSDCLITREPNETFAYNTAHSVFRWPEFSLRQMLQYNFMGPQPVWRSSLHASVGVFDPTFIVAGDYDLFFRMAWNSGCIHVPEVLGLYLEGGNESQNQGHTVRETRQLLANYRRKVPLEHIYPLADYPSDSLARAAALVDWGVCLSGGSTTDHELALNCFAEARTLIGDHPVVVNNLGVTHTILGNVKEGAELLEELMRTRDHAAAHNIRQFRGGDGGRADFIFGSLLHPVVDKLPKLVAPDTLRQPWNAAPGSRDLMLGAKSRDITVMHEVATSSRRPSDRPEGISFVVITAGKREELLQLCLKSIAAQDIQSFEVFVVGRHREQMGITYIPAEEAADAGRLGEMRNRAVALTQYSNIVILDDDILLAPNWYAQFSSGPQDFDILTSRIHLPDGGRYWDHAGMGGERGKQYLLEPEEEDDHVYMTGGGGWVMKDWVATSVQWDSVRGFYKGEDIDFARRCQAEGYTIIHNPSCLVYHADETYTTVGRWTMRRTEGRSQDWVAELEGQPAHRILLLADSLLREDRTAEAADCLRFGQIRFPRYKPFAASIRAVEAHSGGALKGMRWYPGAAPEYAAMLELYKTNATHKTYTSYNATLANGLESIADPDPCADQTANENPAFANHYTDARETGLIPRMNAQPPKPSERTASATSASLLSSDCYVTQDEGEASLDRITRSSPRSIELDPSVELGLDNRESQALLYAIEESGSRLSIDGLAFAKSANELTTLEQARIRSLVDRGSDSCVTGDSRGSLEDAHIRFTNTVLANPERASGGAWSILRTGFPTDRLPTDWVERCNAHDAVWVPSEFCRRSFIESGVTASKVAVVPESIVMDWWQPEGKALPIPGARGFNFLSMMDWRRINGWEPMIKAFAQEFKAEDDVALILRPHSTLGYTTEQITQQVVQVVQRALYGKTANMPTILLNDAVIPQENMPALYRAANAVICPSHGMGSEGAWLEAMAMGLPIIAGDWAGRPELLSAKNSLLVRSTLQCVPELAARECAALRGSCWAAPDHNSFREQLRRAFDQRDAVKELGICARQDVASRDYSRVAASIREQLKRVRPRATNVKATMVIA